MMVYTMPVATHAQLKKAERLQARLYSQYNNVQVQPDGITHIKIICT